MYLRKISSADDWRRPQVTIANAIQWGKAELSMLARGPVEDSVRDARRAVCMGCPDRRELADMPDDVGFCSRCGCGASDQARLSRKTSMPGNHCPLGRWPDES